ncbi:mannan-binding lectin [Flavobacterium sp. RHBU_3]|uniref:mannan-binding lectin n=1 Tax=Flavobacterium sp. RHBU_3 TaxID=3391184 RepID=UPI0039851FC0
MSNFKITLPAGPIWDQADAQTKGKAVAAAHQGTFTGVWNTVVENQMSVVEVELSTDNKGMHTYLTTVLAGPLWSNDEAQKIGPVIATSYGAEFTGQWSTIVEGVMSVIQIKYTF